MAYEDTIPEDPARVTPPAAGAPVAEPAAPTAVAEGAAAPTAEAAAGGAEAAAPTALETGVEAADGAGNWAQRMGENFSAWWSDFTRDMTGWDVAGLVGAGAIMWIIGNAFGGGGLLGLVISTMLMGFVVANNGDIGRDLGGVLQNMFGAGDSPSREASVEPERETGVGHESPAAAPVYRSPVSPMPISPVPITETLDATSLREAAQAVAFADFSTDGAPGTLTLPPRVTQAIGLV